LYYNDGKIDDNYFLYYSSPTSLRSFKDKDFEIRGILYEKHTENYILAAVVIGNNLSCDILKHCKDKKIGYIFIEGNNNIYFTCNEKKIRTSLKKIEEIIFFSDAELKIISSEYGKNKRFYDVFEQNENICHLREL
jgi:tRNA G10  N-methylase Trm11